jgi:hypothetical protein
MDDVLASIRRIVRSEKTPEQEEAPEVFDADAVEGPGVSVEEDVPLELTSEMRMDQELQSSSSVPEGTHDPIPGPVPAGGVENTAGLRDLVREIVLEELAGTKGSELIRSVLKDELVSGESGANMSKNVLALIQSEVGKAMKT